jgi:cell division protease FtsH
MAMFNRERRTDGDVAQGNGEASDSDQTKPAATISEWLEGHIGKSCLDVCIVSQKFAVHERVNLQMAIDEMLAEWGGNHQLCGVASADYDESIDLARLLNPATSENFHLGAVQYSDFAIAEKEKLSCADRALFVVQTPEGPVVFFFRKHPYSHQPTTIVESVSPDRAVSERYLRELARRTNLGRAFRGQVLSLEFDCYRQLEIKFHALPKIKRDEVILPPEVIERVERVTIRFSQHAERLRAARRHLKRGVLLYGPPGTGKTLSAMYVASQMAGRTVIMLTGGGMGSIETACQLARMLEPTTVILEDVDLIGTEREQQTVGANALLFELLNQMDGLSEDADLLFILTTNRPDVLEPALASRPGRIDQAIEIPLPDADCRRRLIDLYGRGLQLEVNDLDRIVARTANASAAFLREMLRKAALFAAEADLPGELVVRDEHLEFALAELLIAGGPLTRSLLGASGAE